MKGQASETGRVCAKCGAPLTVNFRTGDVKCTYCGYASNAEDNEADVVASVLQRNATVAGSAIPQSKNNISDVRFWRRIFKYSRTAFFIWAAWGILRFVDQDDPASEWYFKELLPAGKQLNNILFSPGFTPYWFIRLTIFGGALAISFSLLFIFKYLDTLRGHSMMEKFGLDT